MMVVFDKPYALRHIGHLDLMRTMQRALRRSGLPVKYSRGFNPHIKLSFASPLSVGIAGECEIMDVSMEAEVSGEAFAAALDRAMPPGMRVKAARAIDDRFPTLMKLAAGFRFRIEPDLDAEALAGAVEKLLSLDEYEAVRKTKSGENLGNVRPYIQSLFIQNGALYFTAYNLQSGSLKPSVVMEALFDLSGAEPCYNKVTREAILAQDKDDRLIPLEVISFE
jgi:radical SAM-linked protein